MLSAIAQYNKYKEGADLMFWNIEEIHNKNDRQ